MSRSGYSDDIDHWALLRWRGQVASAIRGKRGQKLLRELAEALDAMPVKELYQDALKTNEGQFCALGVVGNARGIDLEAIDPEDPDCVASAFDIAHQLAQEIAYLNDEHLVDMMKVVEVEVCGPISRRDLPYFGHIRRVLVPNEDHASERWRAVRKWVGEQLIVWDVSTEVTQ